MAALNVLFRRAHETCRQAENLRADGTRLSKESIAIRAELMARRQTCHDTIECSVARREESNWPAWCGPDRELLRTLIRVD